MPHPVQTLAVQTHERNELVEITSLVRTAMPRSLQSGYVIVYVPHTTAAVTINENADPDVKSDMLRKLEALVPKHEGFYKHAEGNSDAHVKTAMLGNSATVLIENGRLVLGQWQGIYFCEFDGPRQREMIVKLVNLNPQAD